MTERKEKPRGDPGQTDPGSKHFRMEMRVADSERTSRGDGLRRVYVWDLVVRSTHWLIALSIGTLAVTGLYMGDPFIAVPGEAGAHFVMGTFHAVHYYASIVFTLAVLARVYWAFAGSPPAHWSNLIPVTRRRFKQMKESLLFYLFRRDRFPAMQSHNPLAGLMYAVVFGLYFVMILTGLGMYGASAHVDSPMSWFGFLASMFGGLQASHWLHHVVMWVLLVFIVQHVFSGLLSSLTEKNGTLESIFSGYKWAEQEEFDDDEPS